MTLTRIRIRHNVRKIKELIQMLVGGERCKLDHIMQFLKDEQVK